MVTMFNGGTVVWIALTCVVVGAVLGAWATVKTTRFYRRHAG